MSPPKRPAWSAARRPRTPTARLLTVRGIGPWTAAEVTRAAFGDADAVSVGDYHIKNVVTYALTGAARGTDDHMLELLAPFAGAPRPRLRPASRRAGHLGPQDSAREVALRSFARF